MTESRVIWSRTSRTKLTRDGPEENTSDDARRIDWASRNPNDGEMTASQPYT